MSVVLAFLFVVACAFCLGWAIGATFNSSRNGEGAQ